MSTKFLRLAEDVKTVQKIEPFQTSWEGKIKPPGVDISEMPVHEISTELSNVADKITDLSAKQQELQAEMAAIKIEMKKKLEPDEAKSREIATEIEQETAKLVGELQDVVGTKLLRYKDKLILVQHKLESKQEPIKEEWKIAKMRELAISLGVDAQKLDDAFDKALNGVRRYKEIHTRRVVRFPQKGQVGPTVMSGVKDAFIWIKTMFTRLYDFIQDIVVSASRFGKHLNQLSYLVEL